MYKSETESPRSTLNVQKTVWSSYDLWVDKIFIYPWEIYNSVHCETATELCMGAPGGIFKTFFFKLGSIDSY